MRRISFGRAGRPPLAFLALALGVQLGSGPALAADAKPSGTPIGRTSADRMMTVALFLPSVDPKGADNFVAHVNKLGDPLYHHYLTPSQYEARFGARQADVDDVVAWARKQALTVAAQRTGRNMVMVTGRCATLETALGVSFNDFRDATGRTFYAATGKPELPTVIAGKVTGVIGLSSATHYAPLVVPMASGARPLTSGTGPQGGYSAADLRSIYQVPTLAFGAQTQTLAVFEQGGFDPNDVAVYLAKNKLPSVPVTVRSVNNYGGGIDDLNVELETVLDIDMQIAMNPQAKQILVYEDGVSDAFPVAILSSLSAMASDAAAQTISISYGDDESLETSETLNAENTILTQLAAQGQAVFVSSGDAGVLGDARVPFQVESPASQPLVTAVGGTTLLNGPNQSYLFESAWNELNAGGGATGGGVSAFFPLPGYQEFADTNLNGGSTTFRNVPDVAAVGDPLTGVSVYSRLAAGGWTVVGGTSVGAPLWAGVYSLINTTMEGFGFGQAGFANPMLYGVAYNGFIAVNNIHDVFEGNNGTTSNGQLTGFNAGQFYDNTTGLGSFVAGDLLVDFAAKAAFSGSLNFPAVPTDIRVAATPTSATVTWTGAPTATGYFVEVETVTAPQKLVLETVSKDPTTIIPSLSPNTAYQVMVDSVSGGGVATAPVDIFITPKKPKA